MLSLSPLLFSLVCSRSLSLSFPIVDPLFFFNAKIDRCKTCLYASSFFFSFLFSHFLFHVIIDLFALSTSDEEEEKEEDEEEEENAYHLGINDVVVCSNEFVFIHI